jgi:hypothetical protein
MRHSGHELTPAWAGEFSSCSGGRPSLSVFDWTSKETTPRDQEANNRDWLGRQNQIQACLSLRPAVHRKSAPERVSGDDAHTTACEGTGSSIQCLIRKSTTRVSSSILPGPGPLPEWCQQCCCVAIPTHQLYCVAIKVDRSASASPA